MVVLVGLFLFQTVTIAITQWKHLSRCIIWKEKRHPSLLRRGQALYISRFVWLKKEKKRGQSERRRSGVRQKKNERTEQAAEIKQGRSKKVRDNIWLGHRVSHKPSHHQCPGTKTIHLSPSGRAAATVVGRHLPCTALCSTSPAYFQIYPFHCAVWQNSVFVQSLWLWLGNCRMLGLNRKSILIQEKQETQARFGSNSISVPWFLYFLWTKGM